ncbi:magnesium transporter MRS2-like protein [Medicago truncatula]|uniref:Magnesium transporter n=1 Tax=Medicago truncatula TaxID=3880 RepID=G7I488_MEDTR|nr:magnesium transporter MRS2-like protein [Medicago truncatula]
MLTNYGGLANKLPYDQVRDELAQLLEDDDDMADLYLSRKASIATSHFDENDVEELEQLLEAYFKQSDDTLNKLTALREYIDDSEDYINIQLDNHRNNLIQLELFLTSGTIGLSIFSLVAGIFGMNLPFTWNDGHEYMFKWVVIVGGVISLFLFFMIIIYAYKRRLIGSICWKTKVE